MDFEIPTTKTELFDTLNRLYNFYRLQKQDYDEPEFPTMSIERLTEVNYTDDEIRQMATKLLYAKHLKEKLDRKEDIEEKKAELVAKKQSLVDTFNELIESVNQIYEDSKSLATEQGIKRGLIDSNIVYEKIIDLEKERAEKIANITQEHNVKVAVIDSKITAQDLAYANVDDYFSETHSAEIEAKITELKEKQLEKNNEVIRYNNALEEKEYKSNISNLNALATLKLKFLEIRRSEPTKDELVEMGYYNDVIFCVTMYYNTLSAQNAWTDISNETRLIIYLDDYYQNVVYLFKSRIVTS